MAALSPKKKCLSILALSNLSRLAIHVQKVERETRCMRVVVQAPHELGRKLDEYILLVANECPAWKIVKATPSDEECAHFSGRHIVRTPLELSGGNGSSGLDCDELSVISSSTSATGTIRAEQERAAALAHAALALEERDTAIATLEAERAANAANAAALEAERAANAENAAALEAERAANAANAAALEAERATNAALLEELRRLQAK